MSEHSKLEERWKQKSRRRGTDRAESRKEHLGARSAAGAGLGRVSEQAAGPSVCSTGWFPSLWLAAATRFAMMSMVSYLLHPGWALGLRSVGCWLPCDLRAQIVALGPHAALLLSCSQRTWCMASRGIVEQDCGLFLSVSLAPACAWTGLGAAWRVDLYAALWPPFWCAQRWPLLPGEHGLLDTHAISC